MKRKTQRVEGCDHRSTRRGRLDTFERIVHDYIVEYRPGSEREMRWYASQPSLERAIEVAALSKLPSGKRHPHQRRIQAAVLDEAKDRLLMSDIPGCQAFHDLFEMVQQEVFVYDVAHRLGAYLGLEPERVYLHAGTRAGAKALGLYRRQQYLEPEELPEPFQRLSPAEMEDCLCIYKADLLNAPSS